MFPELTDGRIASVGTGNSGDWASRARVLDIAVAPGKVLRVAVLVPVRSPSSSLTFTALPPDDPIPRERRRTALDIKTVRVVTASGAYPVHVGSGALERLVDVVVGATPSGRCAVISDATVDGLWGCHVEGLLAGGEINVVRLTFPPGEAHKTRDTWSVLTDGMIGAGLGRDCCVVALGGGVVGDVAGFVAATYMRGVPFIQIPTTTLAMIDASVGGKTGVDHPQGKNLVGVFYAPEAVFADPVVLSTLDRDRRAQGYAEAIKHGVLVDPPYLAWLSRHARSLLRGDAGDVRRSVVRSVEVKADIVSRDEFESGRRAILNWGHTVAHALELDSGYRLAHGCAVAIGMVAEARICEALGVTEAGTADEIRAAVCAFGLPHECDAFGRPKHLVGLMRRDKKTRRGIVHLAHLPRIGRGGAGGTPTIPVASQDLVRIMDQWR